MTNRRPDSPPDIKEIIQQIVFVKNSANYTASCQCLTIFRENLHTGKHFVLFAANSFLFENPKLLLSQFHNSWETNPLIEELDNACHIDVTRNRRKPNIPYNYYKHNTKIGTNIFKEHYNCISENFFIQCVLVVKYRTEKTFLQVTL